MRRTCFICVRKSSRVNCCLRILRSRSAASVLVELVLGLLDQRHDVAHAEDPPSHPVRVEALELVELLARRGVDDRLAGDRPDREGRAAARVAVELGDHDAVELRRLGEALRDVDGVLAGHRVDHEQDVVRLADLPDLGELVHQLLIDVQAARGVDDQHVAALLHSLFARPARHLDGVGLARHASRRGPSPVLRASRAARRQRAAAGRRRPGRRSCSAWRAALRASRRPSSCRSPAGRPSGSRWGRSGRRPGRGRHRPSAR